MICKVRRTIEKYSMIKKGDSVVVALSGGADSMCLLHILCLLKDEIGFTVSAAHVNHCIRGAEAERDNEFVRNYCEKNSIRFDCCKIDVPAVSAETSEGIEECGRRLRYSFLNKTADGGLIATAHNLNDRIETFIFNFTRGAGLNGLCSIPPVRDNIIRPLIDCSRDEIEEYCSVNSIPYVTDSSNSDVAYSRNRIRHNILPQMKSINSAFENSALRCFDSINIDNDYLSTIACSIVKKSFKNSCYDIDSFKEEHPSIKNRVISEIVKEKTGITPDSNTINKISELVFSGGVTQISSGLTLRVRNNILDFPVITETENWKTECIQGVNSLPGAVVEVEYINKDTNVYSQNDKTNLLIYNIDSDKLNGNVYFRNRIDGDSFRPAGRNCTKTLKKAFNEKHIKPEERNSIIICCDDEGIVFVEGIGTDERVAVTSSTQRITRFTVRRN